MPDTMAGNISKGRIFRLLDEHLAKGNDTTQFYNDLDSAVALQDVVGNIPAAAGFNVLDPIERRHIQHHWLGVADDKRAYWRGIPSKQKDEILRESYLHAVETCSTESGGVRTMDKSIVSYWLCAGSHFEVAFCNDAPTQATMLVMTPSIAWRYLGQRRLTAQNDDNPDGPLTVTEKIWVYGGKQDLEDVQNESNRPLLTKNTGRGDMTLKLFRTRRFSPFKALNANVRVYKVKGDADAFAP